MSSACILYHKGCSFKIHMHTGFKYINIVCMISYTLVNRVCNEICALRRLRHTRDKPVPGAVYCVSYSIGKFQIYDLSYSTYLYISYCTYRHRYVQYMCTYTSNIKQACIFTATVHTGTHTHFTDLIKAQKLKEIHMQMKTQNYLEPLVYRRAMQHF